MTILPVILSGGSGSRLWPLSRRYYPKQFLSLVTEKTMFQDTICRLDTLTNKVHSPLVVCNSDHRFLVANQLNELGKKYSAILLEPETKNTAPAIAAAAVYTKTHLNMNPLLLVLPADHVIVDIEAFSISLDIATRVADNNTLVTFGINPTEPHCGYGYIKKGAKDKRTNTYEVTRFVEKPTQDIAHQYYNSGEYLWNSGMFLFRLSTYMELLGRFCPDIASACELAVGKAKEDLDFVRLDKQSFAKCANISIDYAIMEKAIDAQIRTVAIPLDAGWNDVGSWSSLCDLAEQDKNGNTISGDVFTKSTKNCYLYSNHGILATVGVDELVVIKTSDAVLVANRKKTQQVKEIVEDLLDGGREEGILHRKVDRPWGSYDCIDESENFKVKRITVKPGAKLSLQTHRYRAEHWVVVKGIAKVTLGEKCILLRENESTYIPIGMKHALENPGDNNLELIEVQSGTYLGEDDIVRYEDLYGRI